jgi:hypothetical protein
MAAVPDRWVVLRVRFAGPFVLARLRDNEGEEFRVHWEGPPSWPADIIDSIAGRIGTLADTLPSGRPGPHDTGPVPLALFVDVPHFLWTDPLRVDSLLTPLITPPYSDRVQVVGLPGGLRRPRPPFTLPYRVAAFGEQARAALSTLAADWWLQHGSVRQRGCDIDTETYSDAGDLEGALRALTRDVLVTDDVETAARVARALPAAERPRLLLSIDPGTITSPPLPPPGTALVAFDPALPSAVQSMFYGFVHDLPIHEAVKATLRTNPVAARVFADPTTNHSLRIRDALIALQSEVEALELSLPRVDLTEFLARLEPAGAGYGFEDLGTVRAADDVLHDLIRIQHEAVGMRSLPTDFEMFQQESEGLVPMSDTSDKLTDVARDAEAGAAALSDLVSDPRLAALFEQHQDRVIDIAMQRLDTSPLLSPLDFNATLEAGAVYRMRVHIGNPAPESLVFGPRPPIDPLLPVPDAAGHMLEVVVQGKDFDVIGERTQPLHLPQFGASKPVYFGVRAPRAVGRAGLRVLVYYFNHLVQSWLLEAEVTQQEEHRTTNDALRVSLEYARVERLNKVEAAKPRALSIAANDDGHGTHNITVKGTSGAGELTLPPLTYEKDVDDFLKQLADASRDPKNPKKGRTYPPPAAGGFAAPPAALVLRRFIRQGSKLYQSLKKKAINSNPDVAKAIDQLKKSDNQKIQVVRLEPNYVFPWAVLYDFNLPPDSPNAPVCLGGQLNAKGDRLPCGHTFNSGVYCVNGFWSVRHYLEELIKRNHEIQEPVVRPAKAAVRLVCASGLAGVTDLRNEVETAIGSPHVVDGPTDEAALLDVLWNTPPERPAILIVLGHMDDTTKPGVLDSPGIVLKAGQWLTQGHLDERLTSNTWEQPRPVVMLMACEAAAITARTINDFVSSFHTAGAAAVIGAEAVVASDLAAAFAGDVTKALWKQKSLGKAMARFRRKTLASGNPLAFLFHAIGDVDLTLQ